MIKITQTSPKTNNTPPKEISHIVETGQDMEKGEKAEIFFFLPNEFGWTEQKWRGEMGEIAPKPSVKGWGGVSGSETAGFGGISSSAFALSLCVKPEKPSSSFQPLRMC